MMFAPGFLGGAAAPRVYATWNPADKNSNITLSNGNLTMATTTSQGSVRGTIGVSSGKWYWEVKLSATDGNILHAAGAIARLASDLTLSPGSGVDDWAIEDNNGFKRNNGGNTAFGAAIALNDVLGWALDMDGGTLKLYKNNVLVGTMASSLTGTYYPIIGGYGSTGTMIANFGATAQLYTPPSGYNAGLYQ